MLKDWNLSPKVIACLLTIPKLADEVARARANPPFPSGYSPSMIELFYDDLLLVRSEQGQVTYLRHWPDRDLPSFVEMRFDGQMALVLVQGEVLVNRVAEMANLESVLGCLRRVDWIDWR